MFLMFSILLLPFLVVVVNQLLEKHSRKPSFGSLPPRKGRSERIFRSAFLNLSIYVLYTSGGLLMVC
jgi:hypothetical protein